MMNRSQRRRWGLVTLRRQGRRWECRRTEVFRDCWTVFISAAEKKAGLSEVETRLHYVEKL